MINHYILTKKTAWGSKLIEDTIITYDHTKTIRLSDYSTVMSDFRNASVRTWDGLNIVVCSNDTESLVFNLQLDQVVKCRKIIDDVDTLITERMFSDDGGKAEDYDLWNIALSKAIIKAVDLTTGAPA